ncbi:unnamed protein product [Mytilus coruscus]|uniref:C-type lectin domain-containing protein n=1 Tax=Mytilus coruscus TaxID=42192 RepID=A0A6J8E2J6_MYTCO|nr:unnamed protein product [Mytilus coruscus]
MNVQFSLLTTSLFMSVRIEGNKINGTKFAIDNDKRIVFSAYTTDQRVTTKGMCAMMCISEEKCCTASYNYATSTCRLDTSEHCCVDIEVVDGWEVFKRESPCTGCVSYGCISYNGSSYYKIIEDYKPWDDAKTSCVLLGGKLLEAETPEENYFIKTELRTRATGVKGYWIGGYNFQMDGNFKWISNHDQQMTYSDFGKTPDGPTTQRCLLYWRDYGYAWGDGFCTALLHYVCEFIKR